MRRYLKFAASFWMSAFLMTVAQTKSTSKKKKKRGSSTASSVPTAMVGQDKHIPLSQI